MKVNSGRDYKHLNQGDIPVYGTGGYMLSVDESLSDEDAVGIGRKGTIDRPQFLKAPFWTVDTLFFMTPKPSNELRFLLALSQGIEWAKLDESTGVPSLSKVNIENVLKFVPNFYEQNAIGTFFQTLDSVVDATQRKVAGLKQLKAAYLQQMFPQAGEKVPRVRFEGFTGNWETKKLYELADVVMGQSPDSKNYTNNPNDHILVQGNADMKNGRVIPRVRTTQVTKTANKGDLIISVRAPVGDVGKTDYDIVLGRGMAAVKGNEFIFQSLRSMKLFGYWERVSCGSTFESIISRDLNDAEIPCPTPSEQEVIVVFLHNIDVQITTHSEKVEKLKQLKSAYLQKMFI